MIDDGTYFGDETISIEDSRQIRDALEAAGGQVTLREYTDEEMEAAGAVYGSEQTYSFHHVELVVLDDPENAEWLFQQSKYE